MSNPAKFKKIFQNYILGGTIVKIDYDAGENLPTFHLDNETYFKMEAYVSGADYDESVSVSGGNPEKRFSAGGYNAASFSVPDRPSSEKTLIMEDILEITPFQQLIGSKVTGASGSGISIEIEFDNNRVLSCYAYDYLKHKKYLYQLHQLES
jgi:hypothetical protein